MFCEHRGAIPEAPDPVRYGGGRRGKASACAPYLGTAALPRSTLQSAEHHGHPHFYQRKADQMLVLPQNPALPRAHTQGPEQDSPGRPLSHQVYSDNSIRETGKCKDLNPPVPRTGRSPEVGVSPRWHNPCIGGWRTERQPCDKGSSPCSVLDRKRT